MARRRSAKRRGYPANLYDNGDGYYYYVNPKDGKKKGLGRDKAFAFSEARAANRVLDETKASRLAQWVTGVRVLTLTDWLPEYRKLWIELTGPAPSTLKSADNYFERFKKADFGTMPMNEITTVQIAKYLDEIAENSGKGAAVNIRTRLLDVFNYAITKGHVETGRNPVEPTIPANYEPKRDRLSMEQFLLIRSHASPAIVNAMNLALLTGQRVSDISEMKFVDVKDGFLYVSQAKSQGDMKLKLDLNIRLSAVELTIGDVVKQCRDRIVSPYLVHQTKTTGNYKAGEPLTEKGISKAFSLLRDKYGVKATTEGRTPPTFHEIRSLAERLYRKEYGKEFAQALLGHKTEAMSAKYDDLRGSDWHVVSVK